MRITASPIRIWEYNSKSGLPALRLRHALATAIHFPVSLPRDCAVAIPYIHCRVRRTSVSMISIPAVSGGCRHVVQTLRAR